MKISRFQNPGQHLAQAVPWTLGILTLLSSGSMGVSLAAPLHKSPATHAIVQLQGLDVPSPRVTGTATLPIRPLEKTQVYTTLVLLGKLSGRFLIDTGASTTLLSAEVVQNLKLPGRTVPSERLSSAVAGNECASMKATLHALPLLKLQSVEISGGSGLRFEKAAIPDGLSGVIGMDILRQFDLKFNPKAQTLQLLPTSIIPKESVGDAIGLQQKLGVFLAKLTINSQGPFTVLLDTGADSTFISEAIAQRLKLDPRTRQPIQVLGFCGLEPAQKSQLASVKLQQYEQKSLETIIVSSGILKLLGVDGILGQNFLSKYQQHWRFTPSTTGSGLKSDGTLLLLPLSTAP